tara:strand:- start:718 stop:1455 length:738 start_codon:yes stop_codon:yes gene_type:complete
LFLTLLSFIAVFSSEFFTDSCPQLQLGSVVLIDFERKNLRLSNDKDLRIFAPPTELPVSVVYLSEDGRRHTFNDFTLTVSDSALKNEERLGASYHAVLTDILLPDKNGPWWQKQLYVKRQAAQLTLQFTGEDLHHIDQVNFSFRDELFSKIDKAFDGFNSWRFSKALLLGQDDLWSERDTWVIRTLGLAHLFVVSGLHVGFMFAIGCLISRTVWRVLPNRILLSGVTRWHCDAVIVMPLLLCLYC